MTLKDNLAVLRHADPAAGLPDGPLDQRADDDLARILDEPTVAVPPSHRSVGRRAVLVTVAAVTAGAIGLMVSDPFGAKTPAMAATPPMLGNVLGAGQPAGPALSRLADAAQKDRSLAGDGSGPHVVRTESWSLSTRVDGKTVHSAVVPEITELSWNADRSGHISTQLGKPYYPSAEYESAWKADGSRGKQGKTVRDETWQPGGYTPMFPNLPLPSQAAPLLAALKAGHPIDKLGTGELMIAIEDLYRETQPSPEVRAALLQLLAARPDVIALGQLTDRAGRPAECFAVDSTLTGLPQRQLLMFSPTTATLLAGEDVLTEDAGQLEVRVPSVVSYRLYFPRS
ncbi:CU044_5270 family protein [Streptomyces sp. SID13031]|uniref:CU044_5270 family protein n=1 Tax=Streptomyces sp. SID13031 TaxID=2706046 RepID=UPI0013C98A45|nr:CU044_5270 family protein [Streptomyces sp. SID13031]NEA33832.1 hypothetical protein [Streptomyces sp. SID13031]